MAVLDSHAGAKSNFFYKVNTISFLLFIARAAGFSSDFVEKTTRGEARELRSGAGSRDRRCAPVPAYG
jgi:hypothetical protein